LFPNDEAGIVVFLDSPGRREAARREHTDQALLTELVARSQRTAYKKLRAVRRIDECLYQKSTRDSDSQIWPIDDDMAPSDPLVQAVTVAGPQAVDRILEAVGKQHIPPNLDREALRIDIGRAYYSRDHAFDLCQGSEARERLKRLRRMDKG
jgi:hypothetical protein